MFARTRFRGRIVLAGALLLIISVISTATVPSASAGLRACRADPVILLSNGEIVQTDVAIMTDAANVEQVLYTLHVPAGVSVISVIYTPSEIGHKEVVRFIDDMPPYQYMNHTVITTYGAPAPAIAHTRALLRDSWDTGMTGENLIMLINPLTSGLL
jgi:hypothetical protein